MEILQGSEILKISCYESNVMFKKNNNKSLGWRMRKNCSKDFEFSCFELKKSLTFKV